MDTTHLHVRAVALQLFDGGWHPIELPAGAKGPPPTGRTGYGGKNMTRAEVEAALWAGNIGIRMPGEVIGLDVDVYRGGAETLDGLFAIYGPLLDTWISHSNRNDGSGIRFFRVPNGLTWVASLAGIDIIQPNHRYAVVAPSTHPDGRGYGIWDQAADEPGELPPVDDLPELPWSWINALSRLDHDDVHPTAASGEEVEEFVATCLDDDAGGYLSVIVEHFVMRWQTGHSRHDSMQHCLTWAMDVCRAGVAPAGRALDRLAEPWTRAVSDQPRRAELHSTHRVTEFDAMVRHAVGKANAKSVEDMDKLHDEIVGPRFNVPSPADVSQEPLSSDGLPPSPLGVRRVTLTPASAISPRPVKWLWTGRIALGTLALLGGREGIGKSLVTYQLVADLTRGLLPGLHFGTPSAVLVCATEDSWEHTIVPRLMAAGAALDRVYRIDVTTYEGTTGTLTLPVDLLGLEAAVAEVGAVAIILDPLLSRLSTQLDTHKDAEVRQALEPMVALADRTGVAILGLIHVNKTTTTDPLTMLMASRAFAAVARAVLFVAVDPADEGGHRRYLGQPKNNLGTLDLPMLAFTITSSLVVTTVEGEVWTGQVAWQGEDPRSIADVLRIAGEESRDRTAIEEAAGWLADFLAIHRVASSEDIKKAGGGYGHSERTLKRARERLGAGLNNHGFPRRTWWSKPGMTPDEVDEWFQSGQAEGA